MKIAELRNSYGLPPKESHDPKQDALFERRYRQRLYDATFESLARIVEALLDPASLLDPAYQLSADARITLRHALGNHAQFAALVLPHFFQDDTLQLLCSSKQNTDDVYSQYYQRLSQSSPARFHQFRRVWTEIRRQKHQWKKIAKHITDKTNRWWHKAVIHVVWDDEDNEELMSKQIVLDPTNPSEYLESQYHTLYSDQSHIVGDIPKNGPVEFHLFVDEKCPHRPNELLELLSERSGTGFIMEEWFVGVHIVNLHRIAQINEFMEAAAEPLKVSAKALRRVSRGKKQEASHVRRSQGSQMYEVGSGPRLDRTGHLQPPGNFKRLEDERARYNLMVKDDDILDGIIAVNSYSISVELTLDYGCVSSVAHSNVE